MTPPRTLALAALVAAPCLAAGPALAQSLGNEFQVNTYTTNSQSLPKVARDASGNFVVVWQSSLQDLSSNGVFGQRFGANGTKLGSEFQVSTTTLGEQSLPDVAMDSAGNFVVVWRSASQDLSGDAVVGQRFDAAATKLGGEFQVNTYTTGNQTNPAVAMDPSGNFVVVWQSYLQDVSFNGVFGQRFNSAGTAQGTEFRVNTYTLNSQSSPAIAMDASGNFNVVWQSVQGLGTTNIFGQRYAANGSTVGAEFIVNSSTPNNQYHPTIAIGTTGDFVVAWESDAGDGSSYVVSARRFDTAASPLGSDFQINTYTTSAQTRPDVAMTGSGFVVTWMSNGQDLSSLGVFGQRYDASGATLGSEFRINLYTLNAQQRPAIAGGPGSSYVVTWASALQDGDLDGIFARRTRGGSRDFSGDGRADVLLRRNGTGDNYLWLMNGATVASQGSLPVVSDTNWKVVGQSDHAGDGSSDLLWHDKGTGQITLWSMNGLTVASQTLVGSLPAGTEWEVVGTGDYGGDGKADILVRSGVSGAVYLWTMSGTTISAQDFVIAIGDTNWEIVGSGDFDGDGKADIVYKSRSSGTVYIFRMNGPAITSYDWVVTVPDSTWSIIGTGDHDGNGKADLLWRQSSSGVVYVFVMNGTTVSSYNWVVTVPDTNWGIVGSADYDGDGKADTLWHNSSNGVVYIFKMNGSLITSYDFVATVSDTNYKVVDTK